MNAPIALASIVLAAVAAAGVLRPYGVPRRFMQERLADPLEDERLSLLRSLKDLEQEHQSGDLSDETYHALRTETEARAVAVLRALEARNGAGELVAGLRELRSTSSGNGRGSAAARASNPRRSLLIAAVAAAGAAAILVPLLLGAVKGRSPDAPITGVNVSGTSSSDPLAFFEQRVHDHPNDVAARLDLGSRFLQAGNVEGAIAQYLAALRLDPTNAEAHANLGLVLFRAGRPQDALDAENRALQTDPTYSEAMYFKGVILLEGLNRPADAADTFRAYLRIAPFGSYRSQAQTLLQRAEANVKS
jgi:tetratricopeptide (TPR) repeat protein